jgi:poly(3-hydroxybutyrate) depolymerase
MNAREWLFTGVAATALMHSCAANAAVHERQMRIDRTTVRYKIVLPDGFDADATYPAILVFGGGPQTMRTIDGTLERNFRVPAERLGYIVVAPAAPNDELFFRGGEHIFPEFLDNVLAEFNIRGDRFHIAGPSNGGIAAFHVAALHPEYFLSVTAFPGYLWQPTNEKLVAISNLCVFAYIGENDEYQWHGEMRREVDYLNSLGTIAHFMLEANQAHRLESLTGDNTGRLFDNFALAEKGCRQ